MGCCQSTAPPARQESAFKEYSNKQKDHGGHDSGYTLSSVKSNGETKGFHYTSKYNAIKSMHASDDEAGAELAKINNGKTEEKPSNPLTYDNRSNVNKTTTTTATSNTNTNTINIPQQREREVSVSKSRSRQFRPRSEPNSPSTEPKTKNNENKNKNNAGDDNNNHLPNFEEDSRASSLSGDVEIPGLQLFSDDTSDEEEEEEEHDEFTKKMAFIVQQENKRLEEEIVRLKSFVDEQEIKALEEEAKKEIEAEAKENNLVDKEEEKKRKLRERFEKKQKQREQEKIEAREKRRIKKEEKKKKKKAAALRKKMAKRQKERLKKRDEVRAKRKQELENYSAPEQRPTRKQIINMFDEYFYRPFEQVQASKPKKEPKHNKKASNASNASSSASFDSSDSESNSEDEDELPEKGINFDGFKVGLKTLGIDTILTKSQVEMVWDHMTDTADGGDGISAVDFCFFLKQNAVTLPPKLAKIQRKIVSTLAKQQDIEDEKEKEKLQKNDQEKKDEEKEDENEDTGNGNDSVVVKGSDTENIEIVDTENVSADIIIPEEDDDEERDIQQTPPNEGALIERGDTIPNQLISKNNEETDEQDDSAKRRDSISVSASISVSQSVSTSVIPQDLPRASFKAINYNWNDSMSTKAFKNYKKLRHRFAHRYSGHTPRKTANEELMNVHEKLFHETLSKKDVLDGAKDDDEDKTNNKVNDEKQEEKQDDITNDDKPKQKIQVISPKKPAQQPLLVGNLDGIDETKEEYNDDNKNNDDDDDEKQIERRSAAKSIKMIRSYKGNDEVINLRKLYQQQHKMKKKLEHLRKRSLLKFPAPPKPKNIESYIDDTTRYITKELKSCICKNTRYTGLANFGPNGELGIEIEFQSSADDDGNLTGRRITHFKANKVVKGTGKIYQDVVWDGHKYVPCCKFTWIDTDEGVTTKFEFNSASNQIDVDHSFFEGKCSRYPSDLDPRKRSTILIMHEGFFDFVCVSARRRDIRRNSLLQYHTLDINEMNELELEKVPKYVRRMSAYTEKIDELYEKDMPVTKDALFGDAIQMASAIQGSAPMSDGSLPDQISE